MMVDGNETAVVAAIDDSNPNKKTLSFDADREHPPEFVIRVSFLFFIRIPPKLQHPGFTNTLLSS
jgi:hypothetical protein